MGRHNKFGTGGTGQHFKTKVKEAYQINKAAEKGKIDGAAIAHRKKGWQDSLREHLGKAIDRIDPIDGAIMAALAYLSYEKMGPRTRHVDIVLRSPEYTSSGGASQAPTTKFLRQQTSGQIEELKKQYPTWTLTEDAQSETFTQEKNIENAILGPLAYKLCFSENLAVSSAGLAILGAIGVASLGFGPAPPGTALRSAEDWADWFVKQLGM